MTLHGWKQHLTTSNDESINDFKIRIQIPSPSVVKDISHHEAWLPIEALRVPHEDKSFLLGVISTLQLNNTMTKALLEQYATYWKEGEHHENNPNRKRNMGRYTANQWVTKGCNGFIERD